MKQPLSFLLSLIGAFVLAAGCASAQLLLADGGRSDYRIVLSREASPSEQHAARELQHFLREISGVELPIVTDDSARGNAEILLGDNAHLRALGVTVDWDRLGDEGFTLRTVGKHLVIAGGRLRGTMYGVYALLEEHLGCRWFSSQVSRIPKRERIELGPLDDTQVPVLEYREPFYADAFDADWCARNRMNSNASTLDETRGGKVSYGNGFFVHTFNTLVPPEQYFDEHPEYFSEVGGQRMKGYYQLCLTNPNVVRIATERVRQAIRENPQATIFSVSQNDTGGWCECEKCRALDEAEGSHAATVIQFVNQIAEAIEKEFPHVAIDTLAYSYTRHPPKTIRPRPNVIVRLCSIECCFSHPLETDDYPQNVSFRDDIVGWFKLTKRLYIWDYVTDFAHYIMPFPNFDVLGPNVRFFVNHGVKGIFEEGNYAPGGGGEFAELRAYVLAKVLWNPDYDVETAVREFMEGYYGPAARPIREYFDLIHQKVRETGFHLNIWAGPTSPYLTPEVIDRAVELFDEAERLAANDPALLQRVRVTRLPVQYVQLQTGLGLSRHYYQLTDDLQYVPAPDDPRAATARRFVEVVDQAGITQIREGGNSMNPFKEGLRKSIAGYPAVSLFNPALRLDVVPGLGGRIVNAWLQDRSFNLMHVSRPDAPGYPNVGGYEETAGGTARSPGRSEEYTAAMTETEEGQQVTLSADLPNGLRVQRVIALPRAGQSFAITTTLTNVADGPRLARLRAQPELALGDLEQVTLALTDAAGNRREIALSPPAGRERVVLSLSAERKPVGGWTLLNRAQNLGLQVTVRAEDLAAGEVTVNNDPRFPTPLIAPAMQFVGRELAPGEALTVTQTYTVLTDTLPSPPAEGGARGGIEPLTAAADRVEAEEDQFGLYREGELSRVVADPLAANGFAAWITGSTNEWAIQWPYDAGLFEPGAEYELFGVIKVTKAGDAGAAFDAGVYDSINRVSVCAFRVEAAAAPDNEWKTYRFGAFVPGPGHYVWVAPTNNPANVTGVYVDRFYFVRAAQ